MQRDPVVHEDEKDLGTPEAVEVGVAEAGVQEWAYPDGGLRAWLVVAGCFSMSATCM
jgi:hypothetical protein